MVYSLRFRLVVVTAAIPLLAILGVGLFASRSAASEFSGLVGEGQSATREARIITIQGGRQAPPPDAGTRSVSIEAAGPACLPVPMFGTKTTDRVFTIPLFDGAMPAETLDLVSAAGIAESGTVLSGNGQTFAVYGAKPFKALYTGDQQRFLNGVNRNLLIGGVLAVLASTAFAAFSARRLTEPLEALTGAARRLGAGDLAHRVDVRSKDEVGVLATAFNGMAHSLERAEKLRRSMTSDIAHELRTPLQTLGGYLDAAADGVVDTDAALVQALREETTVLTRLVEDLEQIALSDAGQLRLRTRAVEPAALLERCAEVARPLAAEHRVVISTEIAPSLPEIEADPERLSQVMRNLLDNAIAHTPGGGAIAVRALADEHALIIEVSDTGTGIAPHHLPFVFERFYRADSSRTRATGGAGLGLAIVRHLVEAHGGTVTVTSELDHGSAFQVRLPMSSRP